MENENIITNSGTEIESEKLLSDSNSTEIKIDTPVLSLSSNHTEYSELELEAQTTSPHLVWNNVTYTAVKRKKFSSKHAKQTEIIKNVSGKGLSGKFTAILGPSGAGKSTLLGCIAGRKKSGITGNIYVTGGHKTKISFCSQKDDHLDELTVRETLLFASRLKNYNKRKALLDKTWNYQTHVNNVNNILTQLGLEGCDNVRVGHCSGGQRKRLTIGTELVSRPNILLLDEPTSGLDSSSCMQCVKLLQSLSRGTGTEQMVVIASIHQPSSMILNYIDYLYVLSRDGRSIYYGPTSELNDYFLRFDISCPIYQTPTDLAIEVASEEFGSELIGKMAYNQIKRSGFYHKMPSDCVAVSKIVQKTKSQSYPFFLHVWLLFWRTNIIAWRQPQLTTLRMLTTVMIALLVSYIYKNRIGQFSGCVTDLLDNFSVRNVFGDATANLGYIFFTLLFITLSSKMPTILTFPLELSVFIKERANGWYSCSSYYLAKSLADIPYQIVFPTIYCTISYFATYQLLNIWRLSNFLLVNIILAFISQTMGLLIGALFANDLTSAVYSVAFVIAPQILFSGFLVPFSEMPEYMNPITYLSWIRFAMEAILIGFYGFDRCDHITRETVIESTTTRSPHLSMDDMNRFIDVAQYLSENNLIAEAIWLLNSNITKQLRDGGSFVMNAFQITDSQYVFDMMALLLVMLVMRIIAYYVLLWKVDRST